MLILTLSEAGGGQHINEDWVSATTALTVVLDGATVRTDTGCRHGVAWYVTELGSALAKNAANPGWSLVSALSGAIGHVASLHAGCELDHPATPSAAVGVLRWNDDVVEYLSLGDVTIVLDTGDGPCVITDDRVEATAVRERRAADRFPIGSPEKAEALLAMKRAELSSRNRPGGYWIAAADPAISEHAVTGGVAISGLRRAAMLTDGAARMVTLFKKWTWDELLDVLESAGPAQVIRRTRELERLDPAGDIWPRNKRSDDATLIFAH